MNIKIKEYLAKIGLAGKELAEGDPENFHAEALSVAVIQYLDKLNGLFMKSRSPKEAKELYYKIIHRCLEKSALELEILKEENL